METKGNKIDIKQLTDKEVDNILGVGFSIKTRIKMQQERDRKNRRFGIFMIGLMLFILAAVLLSGCGIKKEVAALYKEKTELQEKVKKDELVIKRLQDMLDECEGERR